MGDGGGAVDGSRIRPIQSLRHNARDLETAGRDLKAGRRSEDVGDRQCRARTATFSILDRPERRGDLAAFDFDPFAADSDELALGTRQGRQLLLGELGIADRDTPVIVDDRVDPDALLPAGARRRYALPADAESQSEAPPPTPPTPPPGGEQDAEAGIDEDGRTVPEERVCRFGVEIDHRRFGGVEQAGERRMETARAAEVSEEGLLGIGGRSCPKRRRVGPEEPGGQHEARVVARADEDFERPRGGRSGGWNGVIGFWPGPLVGCPAGLAEPEERAKRPRPWSHGVTPPLERRSRRRAARPPGRVELARLLGHEDIDELVEDVDDRTASRLDVGDRIAGRQTGAGHRRGERVDASLVTGARRHRPPDRAPRPARRRIRFRQEAPARNELGRQESDAGEEPDGRAEPGVGSLREPEQQAERIGSLEADGRHAPRGPCDVAIVACVASRARRHRPASVGWQRQDETGLSEPIFGYLPADRLDGHGPRGVRVRQATWLMEECPFGRCPSLGIHRWVLGPEVDGARGVQHGMHDRHGTHGARRPRCVRCPRDPAGVSAALRKSRSLPEEFVDCLEPVPTETTSE